MTQPATSPKSPPRKQIHPRLPLELGRRLRTFATGRRASQNSVVLAALTKYLEDANDGALIIRRLDRLSRAVSRLHRDVTVVADALAVYVQVWLAHTPRIADHQKARAEREALTRFASFTDHVAARVASGRSVMAELVRESDDPGDEPDTDEKKNGGAGS